MISVRAAGATDLSFVSQDGYAGSDVIERKIEQGEVFIAEMEEVAAGYIRVEFLWSALPYISLIRVLSQYQRKGVGKALLAHLQNVLRDAGHSVLFSSSQVNEPEPQAWHRQMGFEECGIINGLNEGGVGEVFFRKTL